MRQAYEDIAKPDPQLWDTVEPEGRTEGFDCQNQQ